MNKHRAKLSKDKMTIDPAVEGPPPASAEFFVECYEYDCGVPCKPYGCPGHETAIPLAFTVSNVTFHVDGAQSGDFPDDDLTIQRVCAVVDAIQKLIQDNKIQFVKHVTDYESK